MKIKQIIPYKLKLMFPAFALAGASIFSGCENKNEPLPPKPVKLDTVELYFNHKNVVEIISADTLAKYSTDKKIGSIYYVVIEGATFEHFGPKVIHNMRNEIETRFNESEKVKGGRGNFKFEPGAAAPADSLWFTQHGWTVNQHQR
ncbi:MAG: hypothetical protein ACI3Z7_06650 [Candidatus Aphodosoma sp.]